jgi:8-hydroxy-5-deazaflavin:NADPH oxidoreductase
LKVAVLGGTGRMGGGVARHLAKKHEVIIGSRDPGRAKRAAEKFEGARGAGYAQAAAESDVVVVAVPYAALGAMAEVAKEVRGKLVISMVNPLKMEKGLLKFSLEEGSAAEELAAMLPGGKVATAFNNLPAGFFDGEEVPAADILVAAQSSEAFEEAAEVVRSIPRLRPLYAGPLSEARTVEMITPLVLNLAKLNQTGALATKFVTKKG